jgi:hypothetical protein
MLLTAGGIPQPTIAAVLGCCERTLRNYFAVELETGRGVKRAQNLERLEAAAKRGNVSAMKALAAAFDRGESQELRAGETAAVRRERAEAAVRERPSKRALAQRAAATAGGVGSAWGDDLAWDSGRPPAGETDGEIVVPGSSALAVPQEA